MQSTVAWPFIEVVQNIGAKPLTWFYLCQRRQMAEPNYLQKNIAGVRTMASGDPMINTNIY